MNVEEKEYLKMKDEIKDDVKAIFEDNLKVFDWDIPEDDDKLSARLVLKAMKEACAEIEEAVENGKYDNF